MLPLFLGAGSILFFAVAFPPGLDVRLLDLEARAQNSASRSSPRDDSCAGAAPRCSFHRSWTLLGCVRLIRRALVGLTQRALYDLSLRRESSNNAIARGDAKVWRSCTSKASRAEGLPSMLPHRRVAPPVPRDHPGRSAGSLARRTLSMASTARGGLQHGLGHPLSAWSEGTTAMSAPRQTEPMSVT